MKVLTLIGEDFENACLRLASEVESSGFCPDVIVGIKTGGDMIGRYIARFFPAACYVTVEASRPGTSAKRGKSRILSRLPYCITDFLRIAESKILRLLESGYESRNVAIDVDVKCNELMNKNGCKVLIIDDAIDSGATLRQVKGKLRNDFPECNYRSAVITVTTSLPVEKPDFWLFDNMLIRFPWSTDLRK